MVRVDDDPDGPNLDLRTRYSLEASQIQAEIQLRAELQLLLSRSLSASEKQLALVPLPPRIPKQPARLSLVLVNYAGQLFMAEAGLYPRDRPTPERWLTSLSKRVVKSALEIVADIEKSGRSKFVSLELHGLSPAKISVIIEKELERVTARILNPPSVRFTPEPPLELSHGQSAPLRFADSMPKEIGPPREEDGPTLRGEVEAYRKIEQLVTSPHLQIPEDLVRRFIARQQNIKPEDVTEEQIRFEVSGLFDFYPAITVIPSRPAKGEDSTPGGDEKRSARLSAMIDCPAAARKMEAYIKLNGVGMTEFASKVGANERTLRSFRASGKVRRDIFGNIATAMGITKAELLRS